MPQIINLESYVAVLEDKRILRQVAAVGQNLVARCLCAAETGTEVLESLPSLILGLTPTGKGAGLVSLGEVMERCGLDGLLGSRRASGLRLPWQELNQALTGFHGGQMIAVGADTGGGKTSFALQCVTHVLRQDKGVLYWSLEMSDEELTLRLLSQLSAVDVTREDLSLEQRDFIRRAWAWYSERKYSLVFDCKSRNVPALCARLRRVRAVVDIGLVVVDHLQLVRMASRPESRTREVAENSRSIKLAAGEFELPFLVLS